MSLLLEIKGLYQCFNDEIVLDHIDLSIKKEQKIGIVGLSGSGKSTLLKLIAQLLTPTKGEIIKHFDRLSYVFQEHRLMPWLSSYENVMLPLLAQKMSYNAARDKAEEILQNFGLQKATKLYPKSLSGGMKARVALARAFVIQPQLMLLDEPFAALDIRLKHQLGEFLNTRVHHYKQTLIYVSHCPEELIQSVDLVFLLKNSSYNAYR